MMRIGNNSQGIWQLFSRMNGGNRSFGRSSSAGGRNTLEDLLSGHYKNSHGVEGMVITEGSNQKRIMPVSDEMKQHVLNRVKDAFYKYNGMSGDNEAELKKYLANKVAGAVKEKVPGWTHGEPIPSDVLDEIFADESITSMVSGKPDGRKGIDIQV